MSGTIKTYLQIDDNYLQLIQTKGSRVLFNEIFVRKELDENIKDVLKNTPHKIKNIILIIPPGKTFFRYFKLPLSAKKKIEDIIKYQFIKEIPVSEQDIYYDYYIEKTDREKIEVPVFAVKKNLVEKYYKIIKKNGYKISCIIPANYYFYKYYNHQFKKESANNIIFIDSKEKYDIFVLVDKNNFVFRVLNKENNKELKQEVEIFSNRIKDELNTETEPIIIVNGKRLLIEDLYLENGRIYESNLGKLLDYKVTGIP